jgi:hypothetical protein
MKFEKIRLLFLKLRAATHLPPPPASIIAAFSLLLRDFRESYKQDANLHLESRERQTLRLFFVVMLIF